MKIQALPPGDLVRLTELLDLPERLHAGDPHYVPPFRLQLLQDLSGAADLGEGGELQAFLATRDGVGVGRVVALLNRRFPDPGVGQLGFFEAEDDPEVVAALLRAGEAWLRARGATHCLAPMNGGAHAPHRFMVKGFERDPFLFEPRNPPQYPAHLEALGYQRCAVWHSFDIVRDEVPPLIAQLERGAELAGGLPEGWQVVPGRPEDVPGTLSRLGALLNAVWAGHIGYVPLDQAELEARFSGLVSLMTDRHLHFLVDGEGGDLGFGFFYPDWVGEVRALQGDASRWGHWLGRGVRPKRTIGHTIAVRPEARDTGGAYAIMAPLFQNAYADGHEEVIVALVSEGFRFFRRFLPITREYALYQKGL